MGTSDLLSETLFGKTRGAVLAILYGHVGQGFYLRQLARLTDIAVGAVQREIRQLVEAGLVIRRTANAQTLYSANQRSPVFREIKSLVSKTVGVRGVLADALTPLRERINLAFIYGSVAGSRETEHSDVDLMIVGKVTFDEVVASLTGAEKALRREINPTLYTVREFRAKVRGNFLATVLAGKKLFVIGDEHDLGELGQE
jgi:uncharacterized protein